VTTVARLRPSPVGTSHGADAPRAEREATASGRRESVLLAVQASGRPPVVARLATVGFGLVPLVTFAVVSLAIDADGP